MNSVTIHRANITTDTLTNTLSHLVRFPTATADTATNRAALDWIENQLAGLPLHIKRYEHGGHPSLVATTKDTKSPKLWLAGHIDTVPGKPSDFEPAVRNGKLHGRGAHDMKFAVAVFITLLQELGASLTQYDLGLMITTDEEIGGYDGVKWLLDEQGYRGQVAITPDSGGTWEMETGSKGIVWLEVSAGGTAAHASRTWEGVNAIDRLTRFVEHMRTNLPAEPCGSPDHQHATLNFATIAAGEATNQVPDSATSRLDIRFPPSLTTDDIIAWAEEAKTAVPGTSYTTPLSDPPYQVKNNGPTSHFRQIICDITGHDVALTTAHGSSDARHFARHDISTINVCPKGSGFHVPDEWVDLEDLTRFYEVVHRYTTEHAKSTQ